MFSSKGDIDLLTLEGRVDGEGTEENFVRGLVCYFVVIACWRVLAWR